MQINSKQQTILVFSDPHQEIDKLRHILAKENYDVAVCLGDWLDSRRHNSEDDLRKTLEFLKEWLFKPNFVSCWGNHDIQYFYDNPSLYCTGFCEWKKKSILSHFPNTIPAIREKLQWYVWIDDFLCSHAGLNARHLPPNQSLKPQALSEWLDKQIRQAEADLFNRGMHWLFSVGYWRGGRFPVGGILWQDFDAEFEPIDGLKQLVGHTAHPKILNHRLDGNINFVECDNLDVDCHLNEYLLIANGELRIKRYIDL